ncbi:DNA recombination protein RmuC [Patescibacteria group bacterium]|nr:DNA recombination protein RmuC [Patescibacteria group bacterium]
MQTIIIYIFGGLILAGVVIAVLMLMRIFEQNKKTLEEQKKLKDDSGITMLNQNVQGMTNTMSKRLDNAARQFAHLQNALGQVQEMGNQMGKQMKDFQDFLHSPKLRGNLGEQVLRDLLEQTLPKSNFAIQYRFRDGTIVDAVVKSSKGIIPIDSKFPIENFRKYHRAKDKEQRKIFKREFLRDSRKHIEDIARKYIKPEENTVDFALMYIPSEPIYYELAIKEAGFVTYAEEKKVLLVSPNSFYYFLRIILLGLEGKKIEERARSIMNNIKALRQDTTRFGGDVRILNKHLTNAKNTMETVNTGFAAIENRVRSFEMIEGKQKEEEKIEDVEEEIGLLQ